MPPISASGAQNGGLEMGLQDREYVKNPYNRKNEKPERRSGGWNSSNGPDLEIKNALLYASLTVNAAFVAAWLMM
jgi:hypothetical protein